MTEMKRDSLESRINKLRQSKTNYIRLFTMSTKAFFYGLTEITGKRFFRVVYKSDIKKIIFEDDWLCGVITAIYNCNDDPDRYDLLSRILIEPFTMLEESKEIGGK